jgi:nucleoside-diphosphate-sugar epimerase
VFLTGATTALGQAVTRQLRARGHRVTGLTVGSANAARVRANGGIPAFADPLRVGELRSALHSAAADVALHLAAADTLGFPHPRTALDAHSGAAASALLEAAAAHGVRAVIQISSAWVYGDSGGSPVDETHPRAADPLLLPLRAAEDAALNSPLPVCLLRAGLIYGAEEPGTRHLAEALRRGRGIYSGTAAASAFVHVDDLAAAVVLAAEQQPADRVLHIADDTPTAPADFVALLAAGLGLPAPGSPPRFLQRATTGELQRALLDAALRLNTDRAKTALGWQPRYASVKTGLEQTLMLWRAGAA